MNRLKLLLCLPLIFTSSGLFAAEALEIMQQAYHQKRPTTQVATLSFRFVKPDEETREAVYIMVWKDMKEKKDYDSKAMFFTESPPDKKGIAYLGWLRPKESSELDEEWVYLPELRMTRRLALRDHDHSHNDDEFGYSLLTRDHLEPRPPQLDDHTLEGQELYNGRQHYLISSTPKRKLDHQQIHHGGTMPPSRRRYWIDKENGRISRIQFYNHRDAEVLDMEIRWVKQQDYWIWGEVEANCPGTGETTTLQFSNIKLNVKLKDHVFHKRSLERGPTRFQ